jgi:nicotinate-nucleotide adenylyltransferase
VSRSPAALISIPHVGILGGTFNPPHLGHVALARHARSELGLERVLLMPANVAPNKPVAREDPGAEHRLAMCRLAVSAEPGVEASACEIERGGTSYTVDTVQAIHDTHPDAELTLIVGADTARTLPGWREPARLLALAKLAVAERDGLDSEDVREALASVPGAPGAAEAPPASWMRLLRMDEVAVSSSRVRELLAAGRSVTELVGEAVAGYIGAHGLYGTATVPGAHSGGGLT